MSGSAPSEFVVLRNGEKVQKHIAEAYWRELQAIYREFPFAVAEALMVARNPRHRPVGNIGIYLNDRAFLDRDGNMHPTVRAIVLSAVKGVDLMDIRLTSPFAGDV